MKNYRLTGAAALTLAISVCALRHSSSSAEPSVSDAGESSASSRKVEHTLQAAGASRAELTIFEGWVKGMSQAELSETSEYVDKNASNVVRLLRREVKDEKALPPAAIFPGVLPAMSCSALRKVSLVDTTIDSWSISPSDGSCRVMATVIHPPANNHIKVFVALPMKSWNGRFMGTGGGGYAGGSPNNRLAARFDEISNQNALNRRHTPPRSIVGYSQGSLSVQPGRQLDRIRCT